MAMRLMVAVAYVLGEDPAIRVQVPLRQADDRGDLRSGKVRSCGCLRDDANRPRACGRPAA